MMTRTLSLPYFFSPFVLSSKTNTTATVRRLLPLSTDVLNPPYGKVLKPDLAPPPLPSIVNYLKGGRLEPKLHLPLPANPVFPRSLVSSFKLFRCVVSVWPHSPPVYLYHLRPYITKQFIPFCDIRRRDQLVTGERREFKLEIWTS